MYTMLANCRRQLGGPATTSAYVRGWLVTGGDEDANLVLKSARPTLSPEASSPGNTRGWPKTVSMLILRSVTLATLLFRMQCQQRIDRGSMQMVEHQMIYSPERKKTNDYAGAL
jgi:hypothetical protein